MVAGVPGMAATDKEWGGGGGRSDRRGKMATVPNAALSPPESVKAVLMYHYLCEGKVTMEP